MSQGNYDHSVIRRYLRGEMSEKEQKSFEDEMERDADLKAEVHFQALILQGLKAEVKEEAKAKLQKQRKARSSAGRVRQWQPYLTIAALLVFAVGLLALLYWNVQSGSTSGDKLFVEHFEPYPNTLTEQTRGEKALSSLLDSAMYFYSIGDYQNALIHLKRNDSKDNTALSEFYKANSYLATEQPEKAISVLEKVKAQLPARYQTQGKWYLALAHIKQGHYQKARKILSEISEEDDAFYKEKAEQVLSQLSESAD